MSNHFIAAIPLVLVLGIVTLVARIAEAKFQPGITLHYTQWDKNVVSYAAIAMAIGIGVLEFFSSEGTPINFLGLSRNGLLILGPPVALYIHMSQLQFLITEEGIERVRWWRENSQILWSDVRQISSSRLGKTYRIRGRRNRFIAVPHRMVGQQEFAAQVLTQVPRERLKCLYTLREARES